MAHSRKLPSGKWQGVANHPDGGTRTKAFPKMGQAENWAEEMEATWRRNPGFDPSAGEMKFADWVKLWSKARNVDRATADKNASHLRTHVLPKWGRWSLADIGRLDVGGWIGEMVREGVGPHTISGVVNLTSSIMQGAMEVGRIHANPCAKQKLPKPPAGHPRFFTEPQAALIVAELPFPWCVAADLDMHVGLRIGELLGLKVNRVDWASGLIHVRGVLTRHGWRPHAKSTKSHRSVPIPEHLMDVLATLILGRDGDELVFTAPEGGPLSDDNFRNRYWDPAVRLAGACARHRDEGERVEGCRGCKLTRGETRPCPKHRKPVAASKTCPDCTDPVPRESPHAMRHTAASWQVQRGVPIYEVQRLLGHESVATTEKYSSLAPDAHDRIRAAWRLAPAPEDA